MSCSINDVMFNESQKDSAEESSGHASAILFILWMMRPLVISDLPKIIKIW